MTDRITGKEYIVLEKSTFTLNSHVNQQKCHNIGGKLPEPKNEHENLFLDRFNTERFLLGIHRNAADQWAFDSDNSLLTFQSWVHWKGYPSWPRTENGNCVSMLRNSGKDNRGHRTRDWANNDCASNDFLDARPRSLICEKATGESTEHVTFCCPLNIR